MDYTHEGLKNEDCWHAGKPNEKRGSEGKRGTGCRNLRKLG